MLVQGWQLRSYAKPLLEVSQVVPVTLRPLVAEMKPKLECRAQAPDRVPGDHAAGIQIVGRVAAPGRRVGRQLLPTILGLVEDEWMQVDLTTPWVGHDEPGWEAGRRRRVMVEAEPRQGPLSLRQALSIECEVHISVRSGLFTQERIHSPATIEPDLDSILFKCMQHLQDVCGTHLGPDDGHTGFVVSKYRRKPSAEAVNPTAS